MKKIYSSASLLQNCLLPAVIVNTKEWVNHWFEDMEGKQIIVKRYPYKTCITGTIDKCSCTDCVIDRAGKKMYDAYEVVSGYKNIGSIIPECCLSFNGR